MNAKHTPGPWQASITSPELWDKFTTTDVESAGDEAEIVAIVAESLDYEKWAANARLIAAAPDLLAALKPVMEEGDDRAELDIDHYSWNLDAHISLTLTIAELRAIRTAITKAEGK